MRGDVQPKLFILAAVAVLSLAGSMLLAQDSAGGEPPPAAEVDTTETITSELSKPPRVTMEFRRAELVEVINLLAKQANANVVIDPGVKGEVTMRFSDVPWMRALSAVVKVSGYTLIEEDRGRIIRVVDPSKLQAHMETRVFQFKHIRPDEYYKARIEMGGMSWTRATAGPGGMFSLLDTLRNMLTRSPGATRNSKFPTLGRLDYYKDGNCICVVDTKPVLDQMESIIRQLDVQPVPILLDVTWVSTSNKDVVQVCANWSSLINRGILMGTDERDPNGNALCQTSVKYPFNIGSAPTGTPSSATFAAFLNDNDMRAILRLLAEDVDTEFMTPPTVVVRHDAGTRLSLGIFVGEEITHTELERSPPPIGVPAIAAPAQETQPRPGVLQLSMGECPSNASNAAADLCLIPHLIVGTNKFILTVIPPDERLAGNPSQVEGFEEFTATSLSTSTGLGRCKRPATIVTHVLIESGQTVVLAWPRPEEAGSPRVFLFVRPHTDRAPSSPR